MNPSVAVPLDLRDVLAADAASSEPVIAKRLLRFCYGRTRNIVEAKDLASEAVLLALAAKGWHRWSHDAGSEPAESLLMHLCNIARDTHNTARGLVAARREVLRGELPEKAPPDPASPPPGEMPAQWEAHDAQMRRAEEVMARLDEDARRLLHVESDSDEDLDASALAERLGWTVKQVYRARERIAYHRDAVLAREPKTGGVA